MNYDPDWYLTEDTEEARERRAFLGIDKKGRPLAAPTIPAPKPKASKPAQYVTRDLLKRELLALCESVGDWIARELIPRIKSLEDKPVMEFQGPWHSKQPYRKGSVVVHDGSCWVAKDGGTGHRPGTDDGAKQWALAAKKGRDAR
jgi:hypothetical protein